MSYGKAWVSARQVPLDRDGNACVVCGHFATDVHHRVIQGMGGRAKDLTRHSPEKLVPGCPEHHEAMHRNRALARDLGYFVSLTAAPDEWPVWYAAEQAWYLLTSGGTRLRYQAPAPEVQL
jgi:hypothetical protein